MNIRTKATVNRVVVDNKHITRYIFEKNTIVVDITPTNVLVRTAKNKQGYTLTSVRGVYFGQCGPAACILKYNHREAVLTYWWDLNTEDKAEFGKLLSSIENSISKLDIEPSNNRSNPNKSIIDKSYIAKNRKKPHVCKAHYRKEFKGRYVLIRGCIKGLETVYVMAISSFDMMKAYTDMVNQLDEYNSAICEKYEPIIYERRIIEERLDDSGFKSIFNQ